MLLAVALAFAAAGPVTGKLGSDARAVDSKSAWSQTLAQALLKNSESQYASLYEACERSDFATLATALIAAHTHISPDKDEYWTDAEYAALKQQAEASVNARGRLVVCQPLDDNDGTPFAYDANRGVFTGHFTDTQNVWNDYHRTGGYVGQTAGGAKAKVTTAVSTEYNASLKWDNPVAPDADCREHGLEPGCRVAYGAVERSGCLHNDMGTYSYEVPVPRDEAGALKAKGYLVILGRLKFPFAGSTGLDGSPTITNPNDIYKRLVVVDLEPDEVAIVDPTGTKWTCKVGSH